ncbi:PREDICTED: uncharacterized protein LOC108563146, partial [Nicrophorus vespilloides]|uniref:Uncharacterized protein LOC108563146 n=1 Tax=Nicrophorus vespilloides TaxID=110193 RepID=A0ABM1MRM9_NICVS
MLMINGASSHSRPPPAYNNIEEATTSAGAPPSYEEAINPNAPPPSYDSLFGRVREARKTSKGVLDFIKNVFIILLGAGKILQVPIDITTFQYFPITMTHSIQIT